MSTQRYISTSFWSDKWIRSLDPAERYLYMYLLTNEHTNIAGVYKITLDRIAFDTGYDERTLLPMLERFSKVNKAHFVEDEWIILPSWPKHQKITETDNNRKGIDKILRELPENIWNALFRFNYQYIYLEKVKPQDPCKGLASPSNYINLNLNLNSNSNMNSNAGAEPLPPPPEETKEPYREDVPSRISLLIKRWNEEGLPKYRYTAVNIRDPSAILRTFSAYKDQEIIKAIKNYAEISKKKTLYEPFPIYTGFEGFLDSGVEKYTDEADPHSRCLKKSARASPSPKKEIIKTCPVCGTVMPGTVLTCTQCGYSVGDNLEDPDNQAFYKANLERRSSA